MLSRNERITVIRIISATARGAAVPFPMDGTDYAAVFSCASAHGFGGLLCRGMKEIYLPEGAEKTYKQKEAEYAGKLAALKKLLTLLDTGGYRCMLLDGAALSGLYPEKQLRCGRDFNILVDDAERERIHYYIAKHGFSHARESERADFYIYGNARFAVMSREFAYGGAIDLWGCAKKASGSVYALSPSDRYICALLKLKQRLDAGFGGVMQLLDVFMLKLAFGGSADHAALLEKEDALGLGYIEAQADRAYKALFLDGSGTDYDEDFIEQVFRDVPSKLPPRYVSPQKKRLLRRIKLAAAITAAAGTLIACVTLILIFNNRTSHENPSLPEGSVSETSADTSYAEIETALGYYSGQVNADGLPDGSGTLSLYNGDVYTGGFSAGVRSGNGKTAFASGGSYEGEYADGVMSGSGTLISDNGDVITGVFADNEPNGKCTVKYSDGTSYDGEMSDGVRNGEGTFRYVNGDVYTGSFREGFREGYGEYYYNGGAVYKGNWISGVQNGDGYFKDSLGEYTGGFSGGVFSGTGKYVYANGDVYEGAWKNGKQNGIGKLSSGGEIYEGSFVNGEMYGSGQKTFANGDIVKGAFSGGKLNGEAQYYFKAYGYWRKVLYEDGKIVKYLDEN